MRHLPCSTFLPSQVPQLALKFLVCLLLAQLCTLVGWQDNKALNAVKGAEQTGRPGPSNTIHSSFDRTKRPQGPSNCFHCIFISAMQCLSARSTGDSAHDLLQPPDDTAAACTPLKRTLFTIPHEP